MNYLIEASVGLLLVLAFYKLFLARETNFSLLRYFLLTGIVLSVSLPLFHFSFEPSQQISGNQIIPTDWIPEAMKQPAQVQLDEHTDAGFASIASWVYLAGAAVFLIVFAVRVMQLVRIFRTASICVNENYKTVESDRFSGAFSFFHLIFIGSNNTISEDEKKQIIEHEQIHAQKFHSLDILLLNVLSIVFWFNPFILIYKKTFIQLHEFEADARAVQNHNVNTYCNLLARVALQSVGFSLANHFNNSLTLKRIKMMHTLKQKVKLWKVASAAALLPILFFVVACHDQLEEVTELAKNSTTVSDYPEAVQTSLSRLEKENPNMRYVVIEPNQDYIDEQNKLDKNKLEKEIEFKSAKSITILKNVVDGQGITHPYYIIAAYDQLVEKVAEESVSENGVYRIVEDPATFPGGREALFSFIRKNLNQSKSGSSSGTTYVMFVINENGKLSDFKIMKGISQEADQEALRVVQLLPAWNPGKQHGKIVKQNFVLPLAFGNPEELETLRKKMAAMEVLEDKKFDGASGKFDVEYSTKDIGGQTQVTGKVTDKNGRSLSGVNVVVVGGTTGTVTDMDGSFTLNVKDKNTRIAASFIGFETKEISLQ